MRQWCSVYSFLAQNIPFQRKKKSQLLFLYLQTNHNLRCVSHIFCMIRYLLHHILGEKKQVSICLENNQQKVIGTFSQISVCSNIWQPWACLRHGSPWWSRCRTSRRWILRQPSPLRTCSHFGHNRFGRGQLGRLGLWRTTPDDGPTSAQVRPVRTLFNRKWNFEFVWHRWTKRKSVFRPRK